MQLVQCLAWTNSFVSVFRIGTDRAQDDSGGAYLHLAQCRCVLRNQAAVRALRGNALKFMRKTFSFLWMIFVLASADVASADGLNYAVTGIGGLSPAVAGVSGNSFWWAGSSMPGATVSGSVLTNYGFDPMSGVGRNGTAPAPYVSNNDYTGSLLLSTPFTVNGNQGLTVTFGTLGTHSFPWGNVEFATLVQNSQVVAVLGLADGMSITQTEEDGYAPGTVFEPLTSGAQMTVDYMFGAYPAPFQLGSTQFGCSGNLAGPCQNEFTSTYTPTAGTYQLLFGSFAKDNNPVAIAVKSVAVPEEGSLTYLALGFATILLLYCRVHLLTTSC
jgi:hypothetical protein